MDKQVYITAQIKKQTVLPLFYEPDKEKCVAIVAALYAGGIRVIEFTNRGENAFENFVHLKSLQAQWKDLNIGVGTILNSNQAAAFIKAGTDFIISPVFDVEIADIAYMEKTLWMPGCMTPTEIHAAMQAGCKVIKLFPGEVLTPAFVKAIKPLFTGVDYIITGGVNPTKESMYSWFEVGVMAIGLGSKLIATEMIKMNNFSALTQLTASTLQIAKAYSPVTT